MDAKIDHAIIKLQDTEGIHLRRARLVFKDSLDGKGVSRYLCDDPNHRWYGKPVYLETKSGRWFANWKKAAGTKKTRAVSRWVIKDGQGKVVCSATAKPRAWYERNGNGDSMTAICVSGPKLGAQVVLPERG